MNSNQFHEQKESQLKTLNRIIQTVKRNSFAAEVKEVVLEKALEAVDAINEIRKDVYKNLENFDLESEYDHSSEFNESVATPTNKLDTRSIQNEICNSIASIKKENGFIENLTNPNTYKKYFKTDKFIACEQKFNEALSGIVEAFSITKKHVITEEDLQNNPELKAAGLNVNDEIELPAVNQQALPEETKKKRVMVSKETATESTSASENTSTENGKNSENGLTPEPFPVDTNSASHI